MPPAINCIAIPIAWSDAFAGPRIVATGWHGLLSFMPSIISTARRLSLGVVSRNAKNSKRLWSSISGLLGWPRQGFLPSLQITSSLCLRITMIDSEPAHLLQLPLSSMTSAILDLHSLLSSVNLKSCESCDLTFFPFIVSYILDNIAPFLLYLFNRSLSEGCIPAKAGHCLLPHKKMPNLDTKLYQNYRPI